MVSQPTILSPKVPKKASLYFVNTFWDYALIGGISILTFFFLRIFHSGDRDRKSTRLNSSHSQISYAVFCLKKKQQADNTLAPVACRRPSCGTTTVPRRASPNRRRRYRTWWRRSRRPVDFGALRTSTPETYG